MVVFGCFGKFCALVVSMPDPIIGASFLVLFGVLTAVDAFNLQYVDLNSSRNLVASAFPSSWALVFLTGSCKMRPSIEPVGYSDQDQVIHALLANNMFMRCFSALVLDNVIPAGADEEHGIVIWREVPSDTDEERDDINMDNRNLTMKTYDLPFVMNLIRNFRW
ncbi:solute carrier family 23 member 2-like [Dreissena polymorpha]|uniref:solute carrier family 23 member 2-like n=1 Tax=Dreissena polymorpha TaxID=45954 RepID=UPI002263C17A|nr:solute carrier family 23 member 2-like [Dreissena polymorpha]